MLASKEAECMFFVGADAPKSSNAVSGLVKAGGCTKAWWNGQANGAAALSKLMGASGEGIVNTTCQFYDNGDGTSTIIGSFGAVETGMLVFADCSDLSFGVGLYEVTKIASTTIKVNAEFYGVDGDYYSIIIGGAWDSLETLCDSYITAGENVDGTNYSQQVWVNKNLAPSTQWIWNNWGCGCVLTNTWLNITGFNEVPGDIVEVNGSHHQSIKSMDDDGIDTDKLVAIDPSGLSSAFIIPDGGYNIRFKGFHFKVCGATYDLVGRDYTEWKNVEFQHCAFTFNSQFYCDYAVNMLFLDNYFEYATGLAENYIFTGSPEPAVFIFNRWNAPTRKLINALGTTILIGNYGMGDQGSQNVGQDGGYILTMFNTLLGGHATVGILRPNNGATLVSIADLLMGSIETTAGISLGKFGASATIINPCCWGLDGSQLLYPIQLEVKSPYPFTGWDADNLLEVDPQLDAACRPHNKNVLLGGPVNINNQKTTIGAVSQEHQFISRNKNSNPGRLGLIR